MSYKTQGNFSKLMAAQHFKATHTSQQNQTNAPILSSFIQSNKSVVLLRPASVYCSVWYRSLSCGSLSTLCLLCLPCVSLVFSLSPLCLICVSFVSLVFLRVVACAHQASPPSHLLFLPCPLLRSRLGPSTDGLSRLWRFWYLNIILHHFSCRSYLQLQLGLNFVTWPK